MKGCLLLHGYTGGPFEVEPLAKILEKQGILTSYPTLHGHGKTLKELSHSTHKDWSKSAEDAYIALSKECSDLSVIGFSMGGLLAFQLAHKYQPKCMVSMGTPIYCLHFRNLVSDFWDAFKTKDYARLRGYGRACCVPPRANLNFYKVLSQTRPFVGDIQTPIFIVQGLKDPVVKSKSAQFIYDHVQSTDKEIKFYPNSQHRLYHSTEKDEIFQDIASFVGRYL